MATTEFFMSMVPPSCTYQEKQVSVVRGKPVFYMPPELKVAKQKLEAYLGQHIPEQEYDGAVRLIVRWLFPRGKHEDGEYKTTRPDTDNLQKMLKDIMTELHYWKDDALVVSELVEKFWAEHPGIYIRIEGLV